MSFQALEDKVIIKVAVVEEKTESGLFIPDTATAVPDTGIVVAVGDGKVLDSGTKITMNVKVKDKVVFGKYSGQTVKLDGKEYLIMREEDILGVITK